MWSGNFWACSRSFVTRSQQFTKLCSKVEDELRTRVTEFVSSNSRLDNFYFDIVANDKNYDVLWTSIRQVLILSHGNASVESGLSVNGAVMIENMQ